MYLFFDTETTGLPRNWHAPVTDLANWPRMVQLAWLLQTDAGEPLESGSVIIRPDGFVIPPDASRVHGITTERALREGVDLGSALGAFAAAMTRAEVLVAHNMSFDEMIAGAEFLRTGIDNRLFGMHRFCTMKATTDVCRLPGRYGFKWPTLTELHQHLFGQAPAVTHDAAADVEACRACFFELKARGIISLPGSPA